MQSSTTGPNEAACGSRTWRETARDDGLAWRTATGSQGRVSSLRQSGVEGASPRSLQRPRPSMALCAARQIGACVVAAAPACEDDNAILSSTRARGGRGPDAPRSCTQPHRLWRCADQAPRWCELLASGAGRRAPASRSLVSLMRGRKIMRRRACSMRRCRCAPGRLLILGCALSPLRA